MQSAHLAIDLGASSGRAMLGLLDGDPLRLELEEVHRFEHHACSVPTGIVWNLTGIWRQILHGLSVGAARCKERGLELTSIGVDCWGVDFVLVGAGGDVLGLPHCYRDARNEPASDRVVERLGGNEALYARTGIQRMPFNTVFQLEAIRAAEPAQLDAARRLLFLPDLFHYWLSGEQATERTIASTGSLLDIQSGEWDLGLMELLGLPKEILGPIVDPGAQVGLLRDTLADETGAPRGLKVIAPASHDTASAIAAAPVTDNSVPWAYLSSGTWSLLGAELPTPYYSEAACHAPFTNERGVDSTIRFLKNIAGLWLIQELRREYADAGSAHSFAELVDQAEGVEPFRTLVDPNHASLAAPGAMTPRVAELAAAAGQPIPETPGQFVRCCLESLALCYAQTAGRLAQFTGRPAERLHVVGGGTQNKLLNGLTAGAMNCEVLTGPTEATAIGNALVQAMGCGVIANLTELRQVVARSTPVDRAEPVGAADQWQAARERFETLSP
ncbi:Rhamnulokinase [Posidoniimonas polymericola]|uniref:Rhamnulokinase n=1 Tax=Posidoniimonas polymericola TaxID=2528002 RepID=A0A5C5YR74_9BACT|nr:rhamnulokinase family protein [Posidoniimonas polymericola]TWT77444.1 Rhamnulokinase [Posidoniimonas polymericola]